MAQDRRPDVNISARPWGKRSFWTSCAGMVIPVAALWASMDTGRSAIIIAVGAAVSAFLANIGSLISEGTAQQNQAKAEVAHAEIRADHDMNVLDIAETKAAVAEVAERVGVEPPAAVADPKSVGTSRGNGDNDTR